ncbi:MAG: inorganic diphosphatase [Microthrixaceae bacterium]
MGSEAFEVVVEIPQGSRNKYEIDHDTGEVWLDRHLLAATVYPAGTGSSPTPWPRTATRSTLWCCSRTRRSPDATSRARPVAVLEMADEAGRDLKVLCVPAGDPRWDHIGDLGDVDEFLLAEVRHFFMVYKDLEPYKRSELGDWAGRGAALAAIEDARQRYGE